jgi:hypothetical protein
MPPAIAPRITHTHKSLADFSASIAAGGQDHARGSFGGRPPDSIRAGGQPSRHAHMDRQQPVGFSERIANRILLEIAPDSESDGSNADQADSFGGAYVDCPRWRIGGPDAGQIWPGFSVALHRRSMLWAQADHHTSDLMLTENFR